MPMQVLSRARSGVGAALHRPDGERRRGDQLNVRGATAPMSNRTMDFRGKAGSSLDAQFAIGKWPYSSRSSVPVLAGKVKFQGRPVFRQGSRHGLLWIDIRRSRAQSRRRIADIRVGQPGTRPWLPALGQQRVPPDGFRDLRLPARRRRFIFEPVEHSRSNAQSGSGWKVHCPGEELCSHERWISPGACARGRQGLLQ